MRGATAPLLPQEYFERKIEDNFYTLTHTERRHWCNFVKIRGRGQVGANFPKSSKKKTVKKKKVRMSHTVP